MSGKKNYSSRCIFVTGIYKLIKDPITDYALACAVSEVISDIVSIQRDRDLWRIYVDSVESQKLLLYDGF